VTYDPADPRNQRFAELMAARAAQAEANIAARDAEADANADPDTVAAFDRLVNQRVVAEVEPPPPLVELEPLPEWPVDVLPDWVADQVIATSTRLQVPVDLCAQLAVGVLASICMGHVKTVAGDWTEPTALFLYCAMHSGAGKSPAERAIVSPLREWEKAKRLDGEESYLLALAEHRVAQKRAKELEAQHAKGACDVSEFREAALEAAQPPPAQYRLTVDDTTPERLVQLLAAHKRLALISTEAGLLDMVAGGYSKGAATNLDVYLKAWSAETIIRDRKGGDTGPEATVVDDPLLCVVLTIQPSVIETYQSERRDLVGRGWFARFMPSMPESLVGTRTFAKRPPAGPEAQRYTERIFRLAEDLHDQATEVRYVLDDAAVDRFFEWCESWEPDLAHGGRLEALHDQSSKIRSSVLRLAGVLAAVNGSDAIVGLDVIEAAIKVGEYWTAHAMAVEGVIEGVDSHAVSVAMDILDWNRRQQKLEFSPREVQLSKRSRYSYVEDLVPGLELMLKRGWLEFVEGDLGQVGVRGSRVLARSHPVALTKSARALTLGGRTRVRTCSRVEDGKTPPPPPLMPNTSEPAPYLREPREPRVLEEWDDDELYGPFA